MDLQQKKTAVATLSVASNSCLVGLKLVVGLLIGSVSVIFEAIHSNVDLIAALIALFAVRKSGKPPDAEHPYGHGKVENVSGAIEALLIFVAAGWIIYEAVGKLRHPEPVETVGWGVAVMLVSSVANILVSRQLFKVGEETDSIALKADAWHLRTDVYTSAGVMVALGVIWLGGILWPQVALHWVDPAAAIAVALLIVKAAYDLTRDSARDLLDAKLPEEEDEWIRAFIANHGGVARGMHDFRTRKSGAHRFVEFHVLVPSDMTVAQAHDDTATLSDGIKEKFPGSAVTIHIDPCRLDCPPDCVDACFLTEEERDALGEG